MNILQSIFGYRCPKCRSSKLFKEPFQFTDPLAMPERCEVCDQNFEPEPGFYFGAMFLSYIASGFLFLIPALILVFGFGWSVNSTMVFVLVFAALVYFKLLRTSRSLWIHIAVKYDKKYDKETPASAQK
jgi:uncharacterized protein (DUF983 family)